MTTVISPLASDHLAAGLASVLPRGAQARIVARKPFIGPGTARAEVVTCLLPDGHRVALHCKYAPAGSHTSYGYRSGMAYEAEVYRRVLAPAAVTVPRFVGSFTDESTETRTLVLKHLEGSVTLNMDPELMPGGAMWAARFHALTETDDLGSGPSFLLRYDAGYLETWVGQAWSVARPAHGRYPWLESLFRGVRAALSPLLEPPFSVVHGEYYPSNVLSYEGGVYPVDWDSAALAAAEIDLATLIEWSPRVADRCERAYRETRWRAGPPSNFPGRLAAARLFIALRWLHYWPESAADGKPCFFFEAIRAAGKRLGLV